MRGGNGWRKAKSGQDLRTWGKGEPALREGGSTEEWSDILEEGLVPAWAWSLSLLQTHKGEDESQDKEGGVW